MALEDPEGMGWGFGPQRPTRNSGLSGVGAPGGERAADDLPCPDPSTCKDVVTGQCRAYNPNREKVNETDTWERESGGGRGYCKQRSGGAGGAGGAGGGGASRAGGGAGGGAAVAGGGFSIANPSSRFNELYGMFGKQAGAIWDNLVPIMNGTQTRFSPEVMAQMDSAAKMAATGQAHAGVDNLRQDAIRRGVGRSPDRGIADVQRGATQSYTQAVNQNRITKANADFEDRMRALDASEKWLGQMQQYTLGLDTNAADREKAIANIALGYARIQAERDMLREQLASNLQIANLNNNAANLRMIWGTQV